MIIPCYNEERSLPSLIEEVRADAPNLDVLVVNDGSTDRTRGVAKRLGVHLIDLPCNLGVGPAFQAGMQFAVEWGYDLVVRIDGDGQHPPAEISKLIQKASEVEADLIIGSRFGGQNEIISSRLRYLGVWGLAFILGRICRAELTDPTSGFWLVRKPLFTYFAEEFPTDYPEPEALALLRRQGYEFAECPVRFRPRTAGQSSIRTWGTVQFMLKVGLALFVDRLRPVNRHFAKGAEHE